MAVDHTLIQQAQRLITGANVHRVKTWLFCYEWSQEGSTERAYYERRLREFILSQGASTQSRKVATREISL